jgi:hypothetical protein
VLVVGCGNSELSAQMYDDGFTDITNIDFSKARALRRRRLARARRAQWQRRFCRLLLSARAR